MNILTDPAPKTVTIGGAEVPINSDFRASVRFEMMMEDSSLSELDKTVTVSYTHLTLPTKRIV